VLKRIWRRCFRQLEATHSSVAGWIYPVCCKWLHTAATASFRRRVERLGDNSRVRHPFYIINPQYFEIGRNFSAEPGLRIEAWDAYHEARFEPHIKIGDNVCLNWDVHIGANGRLEIGNNVLIGSHVLITDHSHGNVDFDSLQVEPIKRPLTRKGPTFIEDNVWIGEGACILSGVRIGRNSVIGANSVVTRDVAPNTVVGGVPARALRTPKS